MRRVMIVGQPGSGKSTLARALGAKTGLPVVHIDRIHWQTGWVERSPADKTRLCREAEAGEAWIFESGHSATWDTRIARADTLVWLDRPLGVRVWRILGRTLRDLGRTRPDMADGCPEQLRDLPAFLGFVWRTRRSARDRIGRLVRTAPSACRIIHVRSDAEAARIVADVSPR